MENVVEIKNISKIFKSDGTEFYALKNISFSVNAGEIFGLLGPNGSGKTTLINILSTVLLPDSGTAKIGGYNILKDRYKILQIINSISGETIFHWRLKVKEILKFYSQIYFIPKNQREKRISELIKKMEIENIYNKKFNELSSGQRMRVIITKSLLNKPKVLLLDEPTIGLDPDIASKTRNLIKEVNKKEKTTIFLTSHYMHEVEKLCKRIAFINYGEISDIGTIKKLKEKKFLGYDITIGIAKVKNIGLLKRNGFIIKGNKLIKKINQNDDPSEIIRFLVGNGFDVISFESKKPTLEDYFIKMSRDKK